MSSGNTSRSVHQRLLNIRDTTGEQFNHLLMRYGLRCPECGSEMKVIAFIEKRDQPDVVERILRHCGLWDRPASRAPPERNEPEQLDLELQYVDTDEFLMAL